LAARLSPRGRRHVRHQRSGKLDRF
jgi:hypothetical protein